jgi:cytochrome b
MTGSSPRTVDPEEAAADAALAVAVWDWPVRFVHWSLVLLIPFSWWSAENEEIGWHLWSGFTVLFLILFRLLWGFWGSSTARFRSFVRGPRQLVSYLRAPGDWRDVGHTPLGALSVVALLGLILLQVALGLLVSDENGVVSGPLNRLVSFDNAELARDLHGALFNVLLGLIGLHVVAILVYRLRGKRLVRAMVTGKSHDYSAGTEGMVAAPASRLVVSLIIAGAVTAWIISGVPGL